MFLSGFIHAQWVLATNSVGQTPVMKSIVLQSQQPHMTCFMNHAGYLGAHLVSDVVHTEGHLCLLKLPIWLILVLQRLMCEVSVQARRLHEGCAIASMTLVSHRASAGISVCANEALDKNATMYLDSQCLIAHKS